jgi:hypothetical protein
MYFGFNPQNVSNGIPYRIAAGSHILSIDSLNVSIVVSGDDESINSPLSSESPLSRPFSFPPRLRGVS